MDQQVKLDLDPKKIIQALNDTGEEVKRLSQIMEESLGKEAPKSIDKMEKAAEKGSSSIASYFRNLGTRIKEDMKTAFDATSVLSGLKFAKELGQGIKEVFELEKAFDKLNTRLRLTGREFADFKKSVGSKVAATGQKMEDIFPGIEKAASKGGVKSPQELATIGEALGKVRAATGEGTEALADSVVEILKTQGKKVNAQTFQSTLDTLQATRVNGAFQTAGQAGQAIQGLSPYAKQLGLGTRDLGALAATASKSGDSGQNILQQLMQKATTPGGQEALNSVLGVNLFKNGKMDSSQIGKIDTGKFGKYSSQVMESATGLQGASGADLKRFIESFKTGMDDYKKVVEGANETGSQFETATDNLASGMDKFKEKTKNASREVGDSLSSAAHSLLKGDVSGAMGNLKGAGASAWDNKGTIAGALGMTAGAGLLMGGGMNSLLKKVPGGGMLGGMVGGEAAKAAGIQPVYVTNAAEIGGGGVAGKLSGAAGALGKFGGAAKGALGVGAALEGGMAIGNMIADSDVGKKIGDSVVDTIFKALNPSDADLMKQGASMVSKPGAKGETDSIAAAVAKGAEAGITKAKKNQPVQLSNPSALTGRGG